MKTIITLSIITLSIILLGMINLTSAQNKNLLQATSDGKIDYLATPLIYMSDSTNNLELVKRINLSIHEEGYVECAIVLEGYAYPIYWYFGINKDHRSHDGNTYTLNNISFDANNWGYYDDTSSGTYTYDEAASTETLRICYHIYGDEMNVIVSWKVEGEVGS